MKYLNKIRPFYFFAAFTLGIIYVYLIEPGMRYITKHPTPDNAGKIIYINENKNNNTANENNTKSNDLLNKECYIYKAEIVECPANKNLISQHPIVSI